MTSYIWDISSIHLNHARSKYQPVAPPPSIQLWIHTRDFQAPKSVYTARCHASEPPPRNRYETLPPIEKSEEPIEFNSRFIV